MTFTQTGSVDFYWNGPTHNFNPKNVLVYVEGEYGFIPLIVGKALEGEKKPYIEIMSEKQSVEAFNQMPNTMNPSWTITQLNRDTVSVAISNWWPMEIDLASNPDMWSKAYPMLRDIILFLKEHGAQSLTFFTCMNNQEADEVAELLVYDMHNDFRPTQDLILAPPAWIMPFVGHRLGLRCSVVATTQDEGLFVDDKALSLAKDYFLAIGLAWDENKAENTHATLKNMEVDLTSQRFLVDDDEEGGWLA
jgi:hypothetical protein